MEVIREFPEPMTTGLGGFQPRVLGAQQPDGSWQGWLEFVHVDADTGTRYVTGVETHQRERAQLERWATGLTRVYAEGAFARAHAAAQESSADLLTTLRELVDALDRRVPHLERAGESQIAADAERLRAAALERMARLRAPTSPPVR